MTPLESLLPLVSGATVVRRFDASDLPRFHTYRSSFELALYQGWSPMTLREAGEFIEEMAGMTALRTGEWTQLAIAEATSNALIGDIGVFIDAGGSVAELGFTLCREAQGRGHAARAVGLAVDLVYSDPAVREVRAVTDARNAKSIRLLERLSFIKSYARDAVCKGVPCTELVYVHRRAGA